jgi:acetoin utilization deacetylase AcuC-like enzyme
MPSGFSFDRKFLDHLTGPGHPEKPERATSIIEHLDRQSWAGELHRIAPLPADERWIESIHSEKYRRHAETACKNGLAYLDSMDVSISESSYDVALLAAGAPLVLADALVAKKIDNGFALVRPPGHHAEYDAALGFCLFNNVAVVARYLQIAHGLEKIAIVDWDVHHGNGTQHSFETDPSILYISTHQYPFYPGTGAFDETGEGRGRGATLNCPMPAGASDKDYESAFRTKVLPALEDFAPECILISAGFDAHSDDPLAQVNLSTDMFAWMTKRLVEIADKTADGRIISLLEGGYNLSRVAECVAVHLEVLLNAANSRLV